MAQNYKRSKRGISMFSAMLRITDEAATGCLSCLAKSFLPYTGSTALATEEETAEVSGFAADSYSPLFLVELGLSIGVLFFVLKALRAQPVQHNDKLSYQGALHWLTAASKQAVAVEPSTNNPVTAPTP